MADDIFNAELVESRPRRPKWRLASKLARYTSIKTYRFVVRNQPAEFIHKKYGNGETVTGFFQGRHHPVFLEARFDYGSYKTGAARDLLKHFEALR